MTPPSTTPRFAWLPWACLALGLGGVLYGMIGFWSRGYDNYDRACIFLATAWLLWTNHSRFIALPDVPRPRLGLALVALGAFAFLPPWYVYSQIGPRPIILWWESLALVAATVGVMLIRSGPNLFYEARFLLVFPLFALPLPGRIQNPLHEIMQAISADLGAELLPLLGSPVLERSGNRILLTSGGIHIAEVCSGLYMIRTTLSITAFIAHLYKFTLARGLFLMAFSLPVIVLVNALRVTAFGVLQDAGQPEFVVPGWRHDLVGYIAYIPGLLLVLGLARKLIPKAAATVESTGEPTPDSHGSLLTPLPLREGLGEGKYPEEIQPSPSPSLRGRGEKFAISNLTPGPTRVAGAVLLAAVAAAAAILAAPGVSTSVSIEPDFDAFPDKLGDHWQRHRPDPPEDEEVHTKLTYNSVLHRYYTTQAGEVAEVWIIYWKSAMTVKDYHHPDVCFIGRGDQMTAKAVDNLTTPAGRRVPLTYREFDSGPDRRKYVVYWTQEGHRLWTDADEARAASFLFPFYWMRDHFREGRAVDETDDRLVVLIGLPRVPGDPKRTLESLAGRVADELYKICPWADPGK